MESKSEKTQENFLFFAWAISVVATLGSLYFSEIKQFEPCELCWYQRILMYPLTILLGIASVKKNYGIALYSAVFSGIGFCLSFYHYLIQKVPFFTSGAPACGRVPCTGQYINWFGFVTIPFLALIAFILILAISLLLLRMTKGVDRR
ncbi:disulfide bond formation protein B [Siminovitchia terrae]|uniref:Probable disulfide formation protein n=1 Tax=Siminovitchia terrae TaxID=1914933 RepID=A0A429X6X4_SIMTE|nr:disulfide oxidoreductase [Siminovitchia terrae]RST59154.1 disulfide bond formation protein B [Siminovitchia terrae]